MHDFIVALTSLTDIVFSENGVLSDTIDTLYTFFAVKHRIFGVFELKNPENRVVLRPNGSKSANFGNFFLFYIFDDLCEHAVDKRA